MIYEPFSGFFMTAVLPVLGIAALVTTLILVGWTTEKDTLGEQIQKSINKML